MKKAITAGRLRALPLHLSADCCDFVNSMLEPNASKRPSAAALLAHPFVARNLGGPIPKAPAHGPPRTLSTRRRLGQQHHGQLLEFPGPHLQAGKLCFTSRDWQHA